MKCTVKYELNDNNTIKSKCHTYQQIGIGSLSCQGCKHFITNDLQNNTIECKKEFFLQRKIKIEKIKWKKYF